MYENVHLVSLRLARLNLITPDVLYNISHLQTVSQCIYYCVKTMHFRPLNSYNETAHQHTSIDRAYSQEMICVQTNYQRLEILFLGG